MARPRRRQAALSFELLETRVPLAGDIFVTVAHGTMTVKGDSAGNQLSVDLLVDGSFEIFGNDGEVFHVNGKAVGPNEHQVNIPNVTKDIHFNMLGGNDVVNLTGQGVAVDLIRNLTVNTGAGSDRFEIDVGKINGTVTIDAGKGDLAADADVVLLQDVTVQKRVTISTGKGADFITLQNVAANQTTFSDQVVLKSGDDADHVIITGNVQFAKNLTINTGNATGGIDSVQITGGPKISGNLSITTGNGNDFIELGAATAGKATVSTGAGSDVVNLGVGGAATVDRALLSLGLGDDIVNIGVNKLTLNGPKKTTVSGGKGADTINGLGNIVGDQFVAESGIEVKNQ